MAYTVIVSECCDAEVREVEKGEEVIIECLNCGKQCDTHEVCEFCRGTGRIEGTDSEGFPSGRFTKCQECIDGHDADANND